MSVKETGAELAKLPSAVGIDYKWTDIVLRRPIADVGKPIVDQQIKLSARCIGTIDGSDEPDDQIQISVSLTTEDLLALPATIRTKIKAFVAVCEKGCAKEGQTFTGDFTL